MEQHSVEAVLAFCDLYHLCPRKCCWWAIVNRTTPSDYPTHMIVSQQMSCLSENCSSSYIMSFSPPTRTVREPGNPISCSATQGSIPGMLPFPTCVGSFSACAGWLPSHLCGLPSCMCGLSSHFCGLSPCMWVLSMMGPSPLGWGTTKKKKKTT